MARIRLLGTRPTITVVACRVSTHGRCWVKCWVHDQRHEGQRDDEQDPDQHVGLVLQRREEAAVRLGRGGHLVGEALRAHGLGLVPAVAGYAEAARQHGVAGALDDEVGLAGEQRLVDLEVARSHDVAVDHDLVAGPRADDVADDELAGVDLALAAVAQHDGVRPGEDGDAVEGALGAHLLVEADHRVGEHDARPRAARRGSDGRR